MKIRDSHTGKPIFTVLQIQLACPACLDKKVDCPHMYHLIPRWQTSGKHQRLKAIMQDRPDLIQSELAGLAFDSLQQCFRAADIETMFTQPCPAHDLHPDVFIFVDPAAGGPGSDYAVLGLLREKGLVTVRGQHTKYRFFTLLRNSSCVMSVLVKKGSMASSRSAMKNASALRGGMGAMPGTPLQMMSLSPMSASSSRKNTTRQNSSCHSSTYHSSARRSMHPRSRSRMSRTSLPYKTLKTMLLSQVIALDVLRDCKGELGV